MEYSKTCLKRPLKKITKMGFNTNYRLMQVKSIAECSKHSAILSTSIKLSFSIMTLVMSIFKWPLTTGFTGTSSSLADARIKGVVLGR